MNIVITDYFDQNNIKTNRIENYSYNQSTTLKDLFRELHLNMPIGNPYFIIDKQVVRYILRDGKYVWYLPFDQVTLQEFIFTYSIEDLSLDYGGGIGGLDFNALMTMLTYIVTLHECYKIAKGTFNLLKNHISRKKQMRYVNELKSNDNYILPIDLHLLLHSQDEWNFKQLQKALMIKDSKLLKMILNFEGFKKVKDGLYIYDDNLYKRNQGASKKIHSNQ